MFALVIHTPPCSGSMLLQGCPPPSLRTTALEFHIRSYCICVRMHTYTYLPSDFLLRVSASSWTFQREGKGLLLQWLVLLPELPSGQLLSHPCTPAAQLGHQQAQGVKAHARLYENTHHLISTTTVEPGSIFATTQLGVLLFTCWSLR